MRCPDCNKEMIGVEYAYGSPNRYDGVSEWACSKCGARYGRWTGRKLADGESEPRYGKPLPKKEPSDAG